MKGRQFIAVLGTFAISVAISHVPPTPTHQHQYFQHPLEQAPYTTSLPAVVEYTLRTNPDVLISINQRYQSNTVFRQDLAGYMPSMDLTGETGRERTRNQNTNRDFLHLERSSYSLSLTENVFNGFQTYFNVRSDLANIASQASAVKNTSENTALAVTEVYLNIIRAKQLVAVARKNVATHVKTYEVIAKRVRKGLSSESELSQTRGRVALAKSDLLNQLKGLQDARAQYLEVVGVTPKRLKSPIADFRNAAKVTSKQQAILQALIHNPALRASQYSLNASIESHKAALNPYYPSINLVASRTRGENINGQVGPNDDDSLYVEANLNLFRGGADYARYRETAYKEQEAFNELGKTKRQIVNNTELSWNAWNTAVKDLNQLRIHMTESKVVVVAYRKQYTLGKRTLIDLLNAEAEYFRSSSAYIDGRFNILLNKYRVLSSEGKLVRHFSARLPEAAHVKVNPYHPNYVTEVKDGKIDVNALPPITPTSGPSFQVHTASIPKPYVGTFHVVTKTTAPVKPTPAKPNSQTIELNAPVYTPPITKPATPVEKPVSQLKTTYQVINLSKPTATVKQQPKVSYQTSQLNAPIYTPAAKATVTCSPDKRTSVRASGKTIPGCATLTRAAKTVKPKYQVVNLAPLKAPVVTVAVKPAVKPVVAQQSAPPITVVYQKVLPTPVQTPNYHVVKVKYRDLPNYSVAQQNAKNHI